MKKEIKDIFVGIAKFYSNSGNSVENTQFSESNYVPSDSVILLFGIYLNDLIFYSTGIFSFMFIATLFTTVRKWKQPKCSTAV